MKKLVFATAAVAAAALFGSAAMAGKPSTKGNGLPLISMQDSWQLNIHAYDTCPTNPFDDTMRRTIVVQAYLGDFTDVTNNRNVPDSSQLNNILLTSNNTDTWQVVDGNACDDDPAELTLPAMVATNYNVYVKYVGKPGTQLDPALCAKDASDNYYCSDGTSVTVRTTGNGSTKFFDATTALLSLPDPGTFCNGNLCDLFDPGLSGYFWDWSATSGAKAIVVFLPCTNDRSSYADPTLQACF